jgi:hypothetical protein
MRLSTRLRKNACALVLLVCLAVGLYPRPTSAAPQLGVKKLVCIVLLSGTVIGLGGRLYHRTSTSHRLMPLFSVLRAQTSPPWPGVKGQVMMVDDLNVRRFAFWELHSLLNLSGPSPYLLSQETLHLKGKEHAERLRQVLLPYLSDPVIADAVVTLEIPIHDPEAFRRFVYPIDSQNGWLPGKFSKNLLEDLGLISGYQQDTKFAHADALVQLTTYIYYARHSKDPEFSGILRLKASED